MPISGCPFQIYQITLLTKKHTSIRFFRVKKYIDGVLGPISANYGVPGCKTRGQWPFRGAGNNDVKFNLGVELCEYNYCNKQMHIAFHIHFHGSEAKVASKWPRNSYLIHHLNVFSKQPIRTKKALTVTFWAIVIR